jgi:hypothetical protein
MNATIAREEIHRKPSVVVAELVSSDTLIVVILSSLHCPLASVQYYGLLTAPTVFSVT